jgi:hypothetical protein
MMIPGFVVQGIVLTRTLEKGPGAPASFNELMMMLLTALVFLQGWPLVWYLLLYRLRTRSQVLVGKQRLVWRRRLLGIGSDEVTQADSVDVRVEQLFSVTRSTTGALRIRGDIRRLYSTTGTGSLDSIRKACCFTLPAYYEEMDDIEHALTRLVRPTVDSSCRKQKKRGSNWSVH